MPPKESKNWYKIRCLECNVEMDFDYKKKHNLNFHKDLLRERKSIRYNVVGAQKKPFEAFKCSKLSKTGICTEVPHTALQEDGKSDLSVIQPNSDFSNHGHGAPKTKNPFETETIRCWLCRIITKNCQTA